MTTDPLTMIASTPTPTLAMSPIVINLLVGAFLLVSVVMILIVLIQRPQGGGLGGAFGAGGGSGGAGQTAFGTKTGDVLTWATIGIFVLFLCFAIGLNFATRPSAMNPQPTISAPGGPGAQTPASDTPAQEEPSQEETGQEDSGAEQGAEEASGDAPPDADPEPDPAPEPGTDPRGDG